VFALVGPQCPVVIEGVECADGLLLTPVVAEFDSGIR
jgi:hypothetical protein